MFLLFRLFLKLGYVLVMLEVVYGVLRSFGFKFSGSLVRFLRELRCGSKKCGEIDGGVSYFCILVGDVLGLDVVR